MSDLRRVDKGVGRSEGKCKGWVTVGLKGPGKECGQREAWERQSPDGARTLRTQPA